ncbi:Proteophosphoglycan ppg4 [Rhodotorula toruloides ATCC 204091]|uniref:Proteophosphoglycan ppg4 n=1 Tax=Rhodotorula toruloides TaxID=5286 RepID=A0A0K3C8X5_RHOTO|nr:Proteophosphoglycan ppg4 [Rhodotorula toruloides ATCC 204091]KAK4334911.1 Proteophosphoglycan ppg4 [Rhodotorula toruloides]PRQ76314.1 Proteophosphoglycan ppg4 [Rhodotorula toruloides]
MPASTPPHFLQQAMLARLASANSPAPPALADFLKLSQDERSRPESASKLAAVLQALSQGYDPKPEERRKLVAALLPLALTLLDQPHHAQNPLFAPLCSLLKFVGRSPAGTEELARADGLRVLVRLGGLDRVAGLPRVEAVEGEEEDDDEDEAAKRALEAGEQDPLLPAESEALRCLANVLTLHPSARDAFPAVLLEDGERKALKGLVRILACDGAGFLGGRLLFLLTSKASEAVTELVLDGACVETMQQFASRYLAIYRSETHRQSLATGPPMATYDDILREHLKLAYNLMLQYSRSPATLPEGFEKTGSLGGDGKKRRFWRSREKSGASLTSSPELDKEMTGGEPSSSPEPAKGTDSPRSKSPIAIAKRVGEAVKRSSRTNSPARSPETSTTTAPASTSKEGDALSLTAAHLFLPLFRPYLSIAVTLPLFPPTSAFSPTAASKDPSPLVRAALNTLLNFPVELEELSGWSTSWLQYVPPRVSPDDGMVRKGGGIGSLGERLLEVLQNVCDAYFPADKVPEHPRLVTKRDKEAGRKLEAPCAPDEWLSGGDDAAKVEEILGPVMLLMRQLSMLGESQFVFRELLFPPDIDRSVPLDRQPTLTGHLVRLLSSVLLLNTAFGVGEFLYNLFDRSPEKLVRAIGYGSASGFLQNRGELIPPPPGEEQESSADGEQPRRPVNPITGAFEPPEDPDYKPMTEEEKEREAERLYTLFDRMAKTGVISAENPVDKARAAGNLEESKEEREAELERLRKEDEELEREVERDMKEWKEKRRKATEQGKDPAQV